MRTVVATFAAALIIGIAPLALADDADDAEVTQMAREHYKAGLDAYKSGKYDVAIKELKKAYLLKRLPPLLLNIAATYRKMNDIDLALHFYQKFLDEAPADAKDRPEVEKTLAELQAEKAGGGKVVEPPVEKPERRTRQDEPPASTPKQFSHTVVDAAPPDSPLDIRVSMPVMKGVKVYVFYRVAGQEDFTTVLMKRRGAEKVGRIPASAMQGKSVQYYVEAKDASGAVVKNSGSPSDPNIVMVDPNAPPQMVASMDDSREPSEPSAATEDQPRTQRRNLDDEEAPVAGQVKGPTEAPRRAKRPANGDEWSGMKKAGVALLAGGGALALIGGAAFLPLANWRAGQVSDGFKNPIDLTLPASDPNRNIYYYNDPISGNQYADWESQGKAFNIVGSVFLGVGLAAAVTGSVLLIVDSLQSPTPRERPRPRRRRSVEEESFFLSPSVNTQGASVQTGFAF